MSYVDLQGARIFYEETGAGKETVVFAHGLLWSAKMFSHQIESLRNRYRCIAFDFRGQGRSSVTKGGYGMDSLAADAAALIEHCGPGHCHFVGHSMGGFVGLRLAVERPRLIKSLTLINSSASRQTIGSALRLSVMSRLAQWLGLERFASLVMAEVFGPHFLADPARVSQRADWRRQLVANDRAGLRRAVAGVVARTSFRDRLRLVEQPTLVVAGAVDRAAPLAEAERLHKGIRHSRLVVIPDSGHTSPVEDPQAVTDALSDFLRSCGGQR